MNGASKQEHPRSRTRSIDVEVKPAAVCVTTRLRSYRCCPNGQLVERTWHDKSPAVSPALLADFGDQARTSVNKYTANTLNLLRWGDGCGCQRTGIGRTCCPPHVPPIRSGTELAYVIANPQVGHRELRPSRIIAHPKVGGPTPARPAILTDGWTRSTPHNRQHTSMLPGA